MEVKINKEIAEYSESIFFGLNLRQCFFSFIACIVAIGIYFLCIDLFGMEITSWLCMLGAAPFAALGFIQYQNMNAEEVVVVAIRSLILSNRKLIDKPINFYYELMEEYLKQIEKEEISKDDKKSFWSKKVKSR